MHQHIKKPAITVITGLCIYFYKLTTLVNWASFKINDDLIR